MAKRIDYTALVGTTIKTLEYGEALILDYEGKDLKGIQWYRVRFENTSNEELQRYSNIRKGKIVDSKLKKLEKSKRVQIKLKKRNKLIKKSGSAFNIEGLKNYNLMALDFATMSIGLSIFINGKHKGTTGIKSNHSDFRVRTVEIVDKILIGIDKYNINCVVIEDIYLSRNSNTLKILAEARGMLMYNLIKRGIRKEIIPASVWQYHLNFPKCREDIKKESLKRYNEKFKTCIECDDLSDSYWLGKYCLK